MCYAFSATFAGRILILIFLIDIKQSEESDYFPSKVHSVLLTVEFVLLQFIENITNPHTSWTGDTPACEWRGVVCEEKQKVTKILWFSMNFQGKITWSTFPCSLRYLDLFDNELTGHVDLTHLSEGLNELWIMQNYF